MADTWRTHGGQAPRPVRALGWAHGGHMKDKADGACRRHGGLRLPGTQSGHMADTRRTQGGHKADMADMLRGRGQAYRGQFFF